MKPARFGIPAALTLVVSIAVVSHHNHPQWSSGSSLRPTSTNVLSVEAPAKEPIADESLRLAFCSARREIRKLSEREATLPGNHGVKFFANNPGENMTARFSEDGVHLWTGREAERRATLSFAGSGISPVLSAEGNVVEYRHACGIVEWYRNLPQGIEHGFTLTRRPETAPAGEIVLPMSLQGLDAAASEENRDALVFRDDKGDPVFLYDALQVWDADGHPLEARLIASRDGFRIAVRDDGARYPVTIDPLITTFEQKLIDGRPPGRFQHMFGISVAIKEDAALVGAPGEAGPAGTLEGAAYLFRKRNGTWKIEARLTVEDAEAHDSLGALVALDYTVDTPPESPGGDPWSLRNFTLAVSGYRSAYVFERGGGLGSAGPWPQVAELFRDGMKPSALSVSENTIVLGSESGGFHTESDGVHIYALMESGWGLQQHLTLPDPALVEEFGRSVAISGDTVLVGAPPGYIWEWEDEDERDFSPGSVYVFQRTGASWHFHQRLVPENEMDLDQFGFSVALDGDTAVVGATTGYWWDEETDEYHESTGSVHFFVREGQTWELQQKVIHDPGPGEYFGIFGEVVAISGNIAVVGDEDAGENSIDGAAYVFAREEESWSLISELRPPDQNFKSWFGCSVAVSGNHILVGAEQAEATLASGESAGPQGAVYLFTVGPAPETPSPAEQFSLWAGNNGLIGSEAETCSIPHHDGVPNLLKYAFNLRGDTADNTRLIPRTGERGLPSITLGRHAGSDVFLIEYLRRRNSGLIYIPKTSGTLKTFEPAMGDTTILDIDSLWERVIVAIPVDRAATPSLFGIVDVSLPAD